MERFVIKRLLILVALTLIFALAYYLNLQSTRQKELVEISEVDKEGLDLSKQEYASWAYKALLGDFMLNDNVDYNLKIAILDSGVDDNHPDLAGRITKEYNAIDNSDNLKDEFGHGTAIAGIIAARHNKIGIKGINPLADIYSVKVSNDEGVSEVASLVRGLEWCIKEGVQIINISLGLSHNSEELQKAIDKAVNSGIVIVASAGNNYMTWTDYPAKYPKVISVNAVTSDYVVDNTYAGYGKIDVVAPGESILTTVPCGNYRVFSGTSIATAHITGIVSLIMAENQHKLKSIDDELRVDETLSLLKQKAIPMGNQDSYGMGFIVY